MTEKMESIVIIITTFAEFRNPLSDHITQFKSVPKYCDLGFRLMGYRAVKSSRISLMIIEMNRTSAYINHSRPSVLDLEVAPFYGA